MSDSAPVPDSDRADHPARTTSRLRRYALTLTDGRAVAGEGVMSGAQGVVVGSANEVFHVDRVDDIAMDATAVFQIVMLGHPTGQWIAARIHCLRTPGAECRIYDGDPINGGTVAQRSPFTCESNVTRM